MVVVDTDFFSSLFKISELRLILQLDHFPDVIARVTEDYFPHHIANYLYELARTANSFYQSESVLQAEPQLKKARVNLIAAVAETIKTGLKLLGIETLEKI